MPSVAALLLCCFAALPCPAQLLKLTGDVPPPPANTGADTLAMADALDRSITDLRTRPPGPGLDAAISLRRIARDLAREGEESGAPGSVRILTARTIADDLPALDAVLLDPKADASMLLMVAANLSENSPVAARFTSAPPIELDRLLRDALAPLLDTTGAPPGPWGWIDDPPTPLAPGAAEPFGPALDAWAAIPGVTPEAITALRSLDKTLSEADAWAAYRRSAATIRAEVRAAAGALPPPSAQLWLAPEARAQLARDFSDAAVALSSAGPMDAPRAEMRRLALAGRATSGVDRLASDPSGKKVRTALIDFLRNRTPDREAERRSLEAFEQALASILARASYAESRALIRHLRPAWKALDKDCQAAEKAVVEVLPRLLQFGDAVTDPAVLTAIASQRRALDDLAALYRASALLLSPRAPAPGPAPLPGDPARPPVPDQPQPAPSPRDTEPAPGWKPIADRLLKVSQDLNKPDTHDAALEQFRAFSSRLFRFADLPGEAEFRASSGGSYSPPGWGPVTGGRAAELLPAIATAREAWLQTFAKTGNATDSARLELLETLMTQLSAAAAIQADVQTAGTPGTGKGRGGIEWWPGWEVSSRAHAALINPAKDPLAKATSLALIGSDAPAAEALVAIRKQSPALLLAGRLERRATAMGLGSGSPPQSAAAELACGAPLTSDAWLIAQREELAHICRYLEDFASPSQPSNPADPAAKPDDLRKSFFDFANSRANRVLEALDRAVP